MSTFLGISGARRNACVAGFVDGEIRAVCEQERLTRGRAIGLEPGRLPDEAVGEVLSIAGRRKDHVATYAVAEREVQLPYGLPVTILDHHFAHAATSFFTSPHPRAAVIVCDSHSNPELTVWLGEGNELIDQKWPWHGPAFASLYSDCTEVLGFARNGQEHRLEALACLAGESQSERLRSDFWWADSALSIDPNWKAHVVESAGSDRQFVSSAASAVQHRLGELLLELVAEVCTRLNTKALCLGGGLFFNTYFNTLIRNSGIVEQVFVPINPGNPGVAVGAALAAARQHGEGTATCGLSPFLGPEYDCEEIKATLDNCKLSYEFVTEEEVLGAAVEALSRGQIVGWFQGRMEWGHRALGNRSILARPDSPYVLENLNCFLKKRNRSRGFGVSVCNDDVLRYFCGPPTSPFMEYEYTPRHECLRRGIIPAGATKIRVQTVGTSEHLFHSLHKAIAKVTGIGVLVNTSFNGFCEPIVCTPRDAVRVFYGTGLDMLVMNRFLVRK